MTSYLSNIASYIFFNLLNLFSRNCPKSPRPAGVLVKRVVLLKGVVVLLKGVVVLLKGVVVPPPVAMGAVIINHKTWEGQVEEMLGTTILRKIVLMLGMSITSE